MDEKIQQAREAAQRLNDILGESVPYKIDVVNPKDIQLLDKNARYMSHDMFQNLVGNVKKDGALSSLPLCWRRSDGALIVLSGNHRVQAATHAGLEFVMILVITKDLTRSEQVAIQLSHNAISGKDDQAILKSLWEEIEDIDLRQYAGLDSELLAELDKLEFSTITDAAPDFKQVILAFLPEETAQLKKALEDVDVLFSDDENFVASRLHYDQVFSSLVECKEKFNIVNNPTALLKIFELAQEQLNTIPMPEKKSKKQAETGAQASV